MSAAASAGGKALKRVLLLGIGKTFP